MKHVFIALPIPRMGHMNHKTAMLVAAALQAVDKDKLSFIYNFLPTRLPDLEFDIVVSHPLMHQPTMKLLRTDFRFAQARKYLLVDDATVFGDSPWEAGFSTLLQGDSCVQDEFEGDQVVPFPYSIIANAKSYDSQPNKATISYCVYVGAEKPERVSLLRSLRERGVPLAFMSDVPFGFMSDLYAQAVASIYLTSPKQENTVTTRAFEGLHSGRYVFFHKDTKWAPPALSFGTAAELKTLFVKAQANDESLWAEQLALSDRLFNIKNQITGAYDL